MSKIHDIHDIHMVHVRCTHTYGTCSVVERRIRIPLPILTAGNIQREKLYRR